MDSLAGQTISHYRVIARLGDRECVYKAEDALSGRLVQLKLLPKELTADPKASSRFQNTVRTVAAMNHPHIAAIFDLGECEGVAFLVTEFPDGETLAQHIAQKPARFSDVLDLCEQVAEALDAAHSAGVVHGGLHPASILLTRKSEVRVAGFGLATPSGVETGDRSTPASVCCQAPEQVRGEEADARTDLFSLGVILYTVATLQAPFSGPDTASVRRAILEQEPPPPSRVNPDLPGRFDEIVAKAIEKDRGLRYQVAAELRTDLRRLRRDWETERVAVARAVITEATAAAASKRSATPPSGEAPGASSRSKRSIALTIAAGLFLAGAVGAIATRYLHRSPQPLPMVLHPLTFRRGVVDSARFAPGGQTIFYTAQWDDDPPQVFSVSPGASESVSLGMHDAEVLAVSPSKELAILTGVHVSTSGGVAGNLENVALAGGAAEPLLSNVEAADWSPTGQSIAVVRRVGVMDRLEYPIGKVLAATHGWIGDPRFSPAGDRIAFVEHSELDGDAGSVNVVDLEGKQQRLTENWPNMHGLAWSSNGNEIWFTASRLGGLQLYAVDLAGKTRQLMATPASLHLEDIAGDGRVLLSRDDIRTEAAEVAQGQKSEKDLSWLNGAELRGISSDGNTFLYEEQEPAANAGNSIYVRQINAPAGLRIGTGRALALSLDGKQVLAETPGPDSHLVILPVGKGQPVSLPMVDVTHLWAAWLPDGKQFVFLGREQGQGLRLFIEDVAGGPPRSISPAGVGSSAAVSPDGRQIAVTGPDGKGYLYPTVGGLVPTFRGLTPADTIVGWSRYSAAVYVAEGSLPASIFRLSLVSGAKTLLWQIAPADTSGVKRLRFISVTPDGHSCFFSFRRTLSQLYLADGLH
ncbi:MAG: protein kinase [Acidobacteriota bacterium]|nr:protein kinase [Acidobacteriota bacterium]